MSECREPCEENMRMISKEYDYAVVGASNRRDSWGYRVPATMISKGLNVYSVNPHQERLFGKQVYPSVKDIPGSVDVAVFIVNPQITLASLKQCVERGIKKAWFQPGTWDKSVLSYCTKQGIDYVAFCIIRQLTDKIKEEISE